MNEDKLKLLEDPIFSGQLNCFERDALSKWAASEIRKIYKDLELMRADAVELASHLQILVNLARQLVLPSPLSEQALNQAETRLAHFAVRSFVNAKMPCDIVERCFSSIFVMSCYSKIEHLYTAMKDTLHMAGREIISLRDQAYSLEANLELAVAANQGLAEENKRLKSELDKLKGQ